MLRVKSTDEFDTGYTPWSKYKPQSPKGRLMIGLYKPIHCNWAIYFYPGVNCAFVVLILPNGWLAVELRWTAPFVCLFSGHSFCARDSFCTQRIFWCFFPAGSANTYLVFMGWNMTTVNQMKFLLNQDVKKTTLPLHLVSVMVHLMRIWK